METIQFKHPNPFDNAIEIIKNHLYFTVIVGDFLKSAVYADDFYYVNFNFNEDLFTRGFSTDFGFLGVNISSLYKYCWKINDYLYNMSVSKPVLHYTALNSSKEANAPFLIGCYAIIYLQVQPQDIYRLLLNTRNVYGYVKLL